MMQENPEIAQKTLAVVKQEENISTTSHTESEQTLKLHNQNSENQTGCTQSAKREYKGLQNQGGTCYMNSLLQSLFMTPEFRRMIFRWRYDPAINADKKDCILYQLQKVFAGLLLSKQPFISTTGLTGSFQWDYKESFQQQDVQEFMRVLFDAIEQSFEINNTYGVVEDIYSGEGSDFIKCLECGYRSDRATKFYDLQLPIRNEFENISNDSIEKAIFGYLKPEILEGKNAYQCSGCNKLVRAQKGSRLVKLPAVLTLQLNRFTLDLNTWQRKKLNDKVSFPMVLNMNHFLDESRQQDFTLTEKLIAENPLLQVKPLHFKPTETFKIKEQDEVLVKNQAQGNFEEFLNQEIGIFDDNAAPKTQGTLAQKRAAERATKAAEHKKNLQNLKKATATKTRTAFDKSKLNSNFFNNAKTKKDEVNGWAHDFDNPDAGNGQSALDEQVQLAIQQSLKDSLSKSSEAVCSSNEVLSLSVKQNNSAEPKVTQTQTAKDFQLESQPKLQTQTCDHESQKQNVSRAELINKINNENKNLIAKYREEGPFVYELFACLLHQGGAMGGHYYAYIKDLESQDEQKWQNFNDYRVSEIDAVDITEMFGGNKGKGVTQTTNAYMLMYRLCNQYAENAHQDVEIPQEIIEEVVKSDDVSKEKLSNPVNSEIKSQMMQLKIVKHTFGQILSDELPQKVVVVNRREDTYRTLFKLAANQFNLSEDEAQLYRLRAFNVHNKIMMETYTGYEDCSLEGLKIYPMKTLLLEQRSEQTPFIDYDPTCMVLKINVWRSGIQSLAEDVLKPVQISVQKDLPMSEFLALLSKKFSLEDPIVMKRNPMLNQRQLEKLSPEKSLIQLRVNEGVNLFVEENPNELVSKWEKEFESDLNRLQVKFNQISEGNSSDLAYKEFIIVDRRITVIDLKILIAQKLDQQVNMLVFKRGGTHGAELIEDDQTLKQVQFYNMICLYIQVGIPTVIGQKRIKIYTAENVQSNLLTEPIVKDYLYFNLKQLAEIPISTTQTVAEAKLQIVKTLGPLKFDYTEVTLDNLDNVIMREKQGDDKLTQVLHDDRLLHSYQVYDGKEIALQIIEPTEYQRSNCYLFMIRVWSPSNWTLTPLQQIFVPKTSTLNDLALIISKKYEIQVSQVQVCKISSSWNFSRVQLPYEQWVSLHDNSSFISSAPFYVSTDGLLLIVKDSLDIERALTEDEQIKYNTAQFEQDQFGTDKVSFKETSIKNSAPKEQGIKITVKKQQTGNE